MAEWRSFNEKAPFGKSGGGSTIGVFNDSMELNDRHLAQVRHEAMKACREGRGTPDQHMLVREYDEIMKKAMAER